MKLKTKFQDEDFELGEVVEGVIAECLGKHEKELRVRATAAKGGQHTFYYSSIKKFMDDWEDAPEEPKKYWCINWGCTGVCENEYSGDIMDEFNKSIGNYFSSKEEAEQAVEKLKAFKRLKDGGFRFNGYSHYDWNGNESPAIAFEYSDFDKMFDDAQVVADLDICFGGEE